MTTPSSERSASPLTGVVADDVTGAVDIGSMFAKHGLVARVFSDENMDIEPYARTADALIVDTNSRLDDKEEAYRKVHAATLRLQELGCTRFINKTCSVFRGNVGAELDAMLDALGATFAVVVLGFPKNGRTTVDGIHYVRGVKLEHSEFRRDPLHPMTDSRLVHILQAQTKRNVVSIGHEIVARGAGALQASLNEVRAQGGYAIVDVVDQDALRTIALAAYDEPVLCGSSAIAEELSAIAAERRESEPTGVRVVSSLPGVGILAAAGSLMPQTAAQVEHMRGKGIPVLELDSRELIAPERREAEISRLTGRLTELLLAGSDAVFHSSGDPAVIEETVAAAAEYGYSREEVSRLVSGAIADIAANVLERTEQRRIVVAGGETSAAVCGKLKIEGMEVGVEIEPGLPSCTALTEPPILVVLKSGSFGGPAFLEKAIEHLRRL